MSSNGVGLAFNKAEYDGTPAKDRDNREVDAIGLLNLEVVDLRDLDNMVVMV